MKRKNRFILIGLVLTILACNSLVEPANRATPGNPTTLPTQIGATEQSIIPTTLSENEGTCDAENWKIIITGVDEVDLGNGTKNVFVRVGAENNGSLWGQWRGPDNDEDTETQQSVFITTKDGTTYGYLHNRTMIQASSVFGQNSTQDEILGRVDTVVVPPGFAVLGQTFLGEPHYYSFAFQMPSTEVPESITISNMSIRCIKPSSGSKGDDVPSKTYNLSSDIAEVRTLPSPDGVPNLVGSMLQMTSESENIEFTGVTREGNTLNVIFNYINNSTNEAYPTFHGYIIGDSRLASCLTTGEYDCELQESYLPSVQPGQTAEGLVLSFTAPENETNLFFVYVEGDVSDLNKVYRINAADIKEETQVLPTETGNIGDTNPLCKNDYFPAIKGATWIRRITTTSENTSFTVDLYTRTEVVQILPDGFNVFGDIASTEEFAPRENSTGAYVKYICTDDGLIIEGFEGVYLPKEMPIGSTWTYSYAGVGELKSTSLGIESVTVPAGTFDAVKVMEAENIFRWYAPGVGDVKAESYDPSTNVRSITELISYSIPK